MEMKKLVSLFVISLMASFVSSSSIMSQVLQVLPTNNELHLTQKCQEKLNITKQSFAKDEIWAIKSKIQKLKLNLKKCLFYKVC